MQRLRMPRATGALSQASPCYSFQPKRHIFWKTALQAGCPGADIVPPSTWAGWYCYPLSRYFLKYPRGSFFKVAPLSCDSKP